MSVDPSSRGWNEHQHRLPWPLSIVAGKLGLNQPNPTALLDVNGSLNVSGGPVTLPADTVSKLLINYTLASDLWTNAALAAGDNALSIPTWTFTPDANAKYLLVELNANAQLSSPTATTWAGWVIYIGGSSAIRFPPTVCATAASTGARGGSRLYVPAAGSQTWEIRFFCGTAISGGAYLRTATTPNLEMLSFSVLELRQ